MLNCTLGTLYTLFRQFCANEFSADLTEPFTAISALFTSSHFLNAKWKKRDRYRTERAEARIGRVRGSKTYHVAFTGPCTALWNNNLSKLRAVNSQIISTYVQKFAQWRKFADVHFWTYLIISVSTPFNLAHLGCKTIPSPESKQ